LGSAQTLRNSSELCTRFSLLFHPPLNLSGI
jgi:hypothetical protein